MRKSLIVPLVALFGLGTATLSGCGSGTSCGPGTRQEGNACVANVTACAEGAVLDEASGVCVPECREGQYWDGAACRANPICGDGTALGEKGCIPDCADGYAWSGSACVPQCAAGTVLDSTSGTCVVDPSACADGSHLEDGACVPDLTCGPGTHAEGGECLPGLPDPDVTESADPKVPATFTVPAAGGTVVLGGVLTTDDTARALPGDRFAVNAPGGTWLRLTARGAGGLRPALRVASVAKGKDGAPAYERLLIEAGKPEVAREVYLPTTGDYEILVTSYDELLAWAFGGSGAGTLPVGGDDLRYVVEVTNLGTPNPVVVDALPAALTGDLGDNSLRFYRLTAPAEGGFVAVSSGAAGLPDTPGDFFPAVLTFDDAGAFLHGRKAVKTYEQAEVLVEMAAGASTLVVQDFFVALGPLRDYRLALAAVTPTTCTTGTCQTADIPDGGDALLRWDLAAGDLFQVGIYPMAAGMVRSSLHDGTLEIATDEQWSDTSSVGAAHYYASQATTVSLWLREYTRAAVAGTVIDARTFATPALANNQTYTGVGLIESPPYTYGLFGIDHVVATKGQLLFFPGFATHAGTADWTYPMEALTTVDFRRVGPILDPTSWNFPDQGITPLIGYARESAHYLHFVWDDLGTPTGGTYDTGFSAVTTTDLGAPTTGTPVGLTGQILGGLKAYRFTATQAQELTITVTPNFLSTGYQPEVWVMTFGAPYFYWVSYQWGPDPDALQLAVVAHETAAAAGQACAVSYKSPYDGEIVLMVESAVTSNPNIFSIQVAAN